MPNRVEPKLIEPLFGELQKERFVTLATIDHETGGPNVSAISWLLARDDSTIFFAVDNRSRIIENIKKNSKAAISVIANETTYAIHGNAAIRIKKMDGIPLKLALVELKIREVRDVMFYGSKMIREPQYDKTYDPDAAAQLDSQVMEAIRKA
ncbi:hypothetical protein A8F94_11910 [Bacillus sp. FJAT-27225]|uniref:pyridoxamine 5'-phosphate oxidase family protein n=1 Tax=Bacillus sp. FJAT-27225 TaxID=1743144 RepID=UPI00080C2229|nr:pyridoxamine 5'-phosphate oxidase family protein [Bacillus sp. FJAT-27225]OCA85584.1 hypothetical protein A8F94_11910 [Bacillus sp. FJAT-27225]